MSATEFFIRAGVSFVAACLFGWVFAEVQARIEQRRKRKEVEEWRRNRARAPIIGFVWTGSNAAAPVFDPKGNEVPLMQDPITGERVQYGWTDNDIREAAQRPEEFLS